MDLVTPGIGLIFWTTLFFLILLFILGKFAWPAILTAIRARNESIKQALDSAEKAKQEMAKLQSDNQKILAEAKAERDAMRVEKLTQQLLTFAKGGFPQRRNVNVTDLVRQTVDFTLSGSSIHCEWLMQSDSLPVYIDDGQIGQVINNLVINAQQAMPDGGTIRVSAMNVELGRDDGIPLNDGSYVKISVEDDGLGMGDEDRKRVFDPFFTTKPTGSGTGLGLSLSYDIIKAHGGELKVETKEGEGTEFIIHLHNL